MKELIIVGGGMGSVQDCRLLTAMIESTTHSVVVISKPVFVIWDEMLDIKPSDFKLALEAVAHTPIMSAICTDRSRALDRFINRQRESRNRARIKHLMKC